MAVSSNTLFHFTKDMETLEKILIDKSFWPKYSEEYGWKIRIAAPMTCFCDIPLSQICNHMEWYGSFGLGLSKEWGISNSVFPLFYVTPKALLIFNFITKHKSVSTQENVRKVITHMKPYESRNKCCNGEIMDNYVYRTGLTSIDLGNSVTSIGGSAFYGCTGLTEIIIPSSVTSIGGQAFFGCTGLNKIVSKSETPPTWGTDAFENVPKIYSTLYVPEVSVEEYKYATVWNEFYNIVGIEMGDTDADEMCGAPVIRYDNEARKLIFSSSTENADFVYSISCDDIVAYTKTTGEVPTVWRIYNNCLCDNG